MTQAKDDSVKQFQKIIQRKARNAEVNEILAKLIDKEENAKLYGEPYGGDRGLAARIHEALRAVGDMKSMVASMNAAMSGDILLGLLSGSLSENVSAAALNAAATGAFKRSFGVSLQAANGKNHDWAKVLGVVSAESSQDPDILAPTVSANVTLDHGKAVIVATFDTDAGVTKTYTPGDEVSVTVQVSPDNKLLGYTVGPLTKTYVVVA